MRLHVEEDPYRCTFKGCNRCFSSPKSLKRHQDIAIDCGIPREKTFLLQNGDVLAINEKEIRKTTQF